MADIRITDLVDERVFADLEKLSGDIKRVKEQYVSAAMELAKGLNIKISTTGDLAKFNETISESGKKAQAATEQLNASISRQREIVAQTTNTISRELAEIEKENKAKRESFNQDRSALDIAQDILGTRDQNIIRLSRLQTELKAVKDAQKSLDDAVKSGTISEAAAAQKRAENLEQQRTLQAAIKDLNLVLNNQDKQMQAAEGSYQKLSLQLEMMKRAYKSLNEEEKNEDLGKRLGEEIQNMDAHLKDLAADMGEFQRNTGNYAIANQNVKTELRELVQEIALLTIQYRNMSDEERNSAQGQELQEKMREMTARASELKDAVADVNREIQSGANDTKNLSAITDGINMLVSGVGGLTAASHALGIGEKDLVKIQTTLQASLAASNALTKAQNALQAESNLMQGVARVQQMAHAAAIKMRTAAEGEGIIVTKAATVAQAAFNAVAKANPYVLLATGIGLLIAAVVAFTKSTKSETEEQKRAREEMEKSRREYEDFIDVENRLAEARQKGIESCSDEIAKLHLLYSAATDVTRSMEERRLAVKKLQETYPSYLGNLKQEAVLTGQAKDEVEKLNAALISNAIVQAKEKLMEEYAERYVKSLEDIMKATEALNKAIAVANEDQVERNKMYRDIPEDTRMQWDFTEKMVSQARERLAELTKQSEDYKKAMDEVAEKIDITEYLTGIGGSGGGDTLTPQKEETAKTYEEIKQTILEATQDIIAERIKMTEEGSEEEYNLTLQYIEAERQLRLIEMKKTYDEERKALDDALAAKTVTQDEYDQSIKDMENRHRNEQINAEKAALVAKEAAQEKYAEAYIDNIEKMYAEEQKERTLTLTKDLTSLANMRAQQLITEEDYQKALAEMQQQYAIETAQKEIEMLEKVLEAEELTADKRKEIAEKLAEAKADLAKEVADAEVKNTQRSEKEEEKASKKKERLLKKYLQTASQMIGKLNGLVSAIYSGQIKGIEEEQEQAEKAHEAEIERIEQLEETGAISKEEAEARKRAAEERSAQKQEELEKKKQELQYKQAVWEKATSIAQAGIATALAITEALPNIVLAALVGAMGAIEIATIIATPIATYAKGTGKDGHPGGFAIVGDAGKSEAVVYGGKMWITPDTPTLVDMPKGAVVYPDADRIPEPVFMTVTPSGERNGSPVVTVVRDSKNVEKGINRTNRLLMMSLYQQRKLAYDAAYENYKRTRL